MSLPADDLDDEGRAAILDFYGDVFGFEEYAELTKDREQLVLRAHTHEQFVFLISDDEPMRAPRMDHFGLSVSTLDDFEEVARRAAAWKERHPDEVDLDEPMSEVFVDALRLHSLLRPLPPAPALRGPALRVPGLTGRSASEAGRPGRSPERRLGEGQEPLVAAGRRPDPARVGLDAVRRCGPSGGRRSGRTSRGRRRTGP